MSPTNDDRHGPNQTMEWLFSPELSDNLTAVQQETGNTAAGGTSDGSEQASSHALPAIEPEFRMRQRVSLACLPCRNRHVKCDSTIPTCSRCKFDGRQCKYLQSRRGGHNKIGKQVSNPSPTTADRSPVPASDSNSSYSAGQHTTRNGLSVEDSDSIVVVDGVSLQTPVISEFAAEPDRPLEFYYTYFHDAHPLVLPRKYFMARLECNDGTLDILVTVMRYIGSLCGNCAGQDSLKPLCENLLFSIQLPGTGFSVQALLLYSIATHWSNEKIRAREILGITTRFALCIGLNSSQFAYQHGEGNPVLEESWRRTWWMLYVVDALYAGIRHEPTFALWSVNADVELPCEEECYHSGKIPKSQTLLEFDNREFEADEVVFSSFAYLIDASKILGAVLAVGADIGDPVDPAVDNADAGLVGWTFHLPDSKKELVASNGRVDPLLFLAHMLIHTTTIYLHRPRSKLLYSSAEHISKCAPPPPPERLSSAKQEAYQLHTVKVLAAAEEISKLLTLPTSMIKQSQFIICMVALSTIAQLSACLCDPITIGASRAMKDRIRVNIGALRAHEKIWSLGRKTLFEVKLIAREVFALQKLDFQTIADLAGDGNGEGVGELDGSLDSWSAGLSFGGVCFARPV